MSNEMDMHPEKHGLYKIIQSKNNNNKNKPYLCLEARALKKRNKKKRIKSNNSKRKKNLDESDFQ